MFFQFIWEWMQNIFYIYMLLLIGEIPYFKALTKKCLINVNIVNNNLEFVIH